MPRGRLGVCSGRRRSEGAKRAVEAGTGVLVQLERGRAGRGAHGLRPARARDRDDERGELEQPRERDLRRRRAEPLPGLDQLRTAREAARSARAAERRVRDHCDSPLLAALDDSTPERAVVEDGEGDLHRRDRRQLERLVELVAVDVGEPDSSHEPVVDEPRRARARRFARASADRACGRGTGRSGGRRARRGSPRSRRGSPSRGRPVSRRRRLVPCRPSS